MAHAIRTEVGEMDEPVGMVMAPGSIAWAESQVADLAVAEAGDEKARETTGTWVGLCAGHRYGFDAGRVSVTGEQMGMKECRIGRLVVRLSSLCCWMQSQDDDHPLDDA
jgi:hypothetical protein